MKTDGAQAGNRNREHETETEKTKGENEMRTNETRTERTREAAQLAYRIERELRSIAPWDFADIEDADPDYLRTWTNDILSGNADYMVSSLEQTESISYLAEQIKAF